MSEQFDPIEVLRAPNPVLPGDLVGAERSERARVALEAILLQPGGGGDQEENACLARCHAARSSVVVRPVTLGRRGRH